MKFTVEIDCDNADFDESPGWAIADLLEDIAERLRETGQYPENDITLRDLNGNLVGIAKLRK